MKFKFILLLVALSFITCKKNRNIDIGDTSDEAIKMALLENLNGDWHFVGSTQINNSENMPILINSEIWKINGDDLEVIRKSSEKYTKIATGKHSISVLEADNDFIFLFVNEQAFGAINLSETKLSLKTGSLPNESISHAPTYSFEKE